MNKLDVPEISVIVPTYNRSRLLRQAIDSCITQTGVSIEILVVDDASTDDTQAVLAEYGFTVRGILLDTNHGSGCFGRNAGIKNAHGQYVKFLDHDDVLERDTLKRELAAARAEEADMVMSGWSWCSIDENGAMLPGSERSFEPPPPDALIEAILGARKVPFTGAVLYRKDYIRDMEWDPTVSVIDDFDWFCRTALKGGKIAVSPGNSYWWRKNELSIQGRQVNNQLNFLESAYIKYRIFGKVENLLRARQELTTERKEKLAHQYYNGLRAFGRYDYSMFRKVIAHIFELCPGFQPNPQTEYNKAIRFLCRIIGVRPALILYSIVRRGIDSIFPRRGSMQFYKK